MKKSPYGGRTPSYAPRIPKSVLSEGLVEGTLTGGPVSNRPSTNPSEGSNSGRSSRRGLTRVSVRGTNGQLWYHFGTRERGCLKRPGRPKNPRKGLLKDAWKTPYLRKGLFEEAWKAQNLRKELLKDGCMASFGTILNHFRPKTTQMLQMVSFGCIL